MQIVSGWKEIAKYLGHGVRTVQRWEFIGLPVHRPQGKNRSAVVAFPHEVENWVHATRTRYADEVDELQGEIKKLKLEVEQLRAALKRERHNHNPGAASPIKKRTAIAS